MTTGVYGIFDRRSGTCLYVGQSKSIEDRWRSHKKRLNSETHLKNFCVWFVDNNKDPQILELRTLEETADIEKDKNEAEIKWFKELSPLFYGQVPSLNNRGWSQAEETKKKISEGSKAARPAKLYSYRCSWCASTFETTSKKTLSNTYCSLTCSTASKDKHSRLDTEAIHELYYVEKLSLRKIGALLGVSDGTIIRHMRERNMPRRDRFGNSPATLVQLNTCEISSVGRAPSFQVGS